MHRHPDDGGIPPGPPLLQRRVTTGASRHADDPVRVDEEEVLQAIEDVQRRSGDEQLRARLAAVGFEGPDYELFARRLAAYGLAVCAAKIETGAIFRDCADLNRPCGDPPRRWSAQERRALAQDTVAEGLLLFRRRGLVEGDLMSFIDGSTLGAPEVLALAGRTADEDVERVMLQTRIPGTRPNPSVTAPPVATSPIPRVTQVKLLIAGGFGVGKTTLVGSVSEITPCTTEEIMTSASVGVDDICDVPEKMTTTSCLDYGRLSLGSDVVLHLFGTPGQTRFWYMWDELIRGCVGAVVMVDTRRLTDCFAALDYFEHRRLPYLVAINCFDGVQYHGIKEVRDALDIPEEVPIVSFDARRRESSRDVLLSLVEHVLDVTAAKGKPLAGSAA